MDTHNLLIPALLLLYRLQVTLKPSVSLSPQWSRIFRGENVILTCQHENGSLMAGTTNWTHNSHPLNESTSSLNITSARELDSGEYRCQGEDSEPSDPVRLGVFSDWLLLQATAEDLTEGDPLILQYHNWKNWRVDKVTFYKDNVSLKYWYENHNISLDRITLNDNGSYHCVGWVCKVEKVSEPVLILVHMAPHSMLPWLRLLVPALLLIMFAVDSVLFVLTRQDLAMLQRTLRGRKGRTTSLYSQPRTEPGNR
ncbi:high affinity immunoglobulin epsilon receptor subunit alpha-like [Sorex fumeus]|uniref:high affinity immunoglobulin epsilon receptor subunit alpha-like n=1 Tax=Sorex fumeus TaxID=62283 RepID=UPI0024AE3E61|nr:high affinity immunoglobulin epsilon receptor subunit alpha-like [Sorex fumeus]